MLKELMAGTTSPFRLRLELDVELELETAPSEKYQSSKQHQDPH